MAQHDITDLIVRIEAAGGTVDQLLAIDRVIRLRGALVACNRASEFAAHALVEKAERGAAARDKAQRMLDRIRAGQTLFTRSSQSGWLITGPVADLQPGQHVTVTKSDGSTSIVTVGSVHGVYEKQGVDYAVAAFADYTPRSLDAGGARVRFDTSTTASGSGSCAECDRYSSSLRPVVDSSGIPGMCCPRCAALDVVERSFA